MAAGPGPDAGSPYLYVADIGDNTAILDEVVVHRFPEPVVLGDSDAVELESLRIRYPGGPMDAESLIVDPVTGEMVIAGKAISGRTRILGVSPPAEWGTTVDAIEMGFIALGSFAIATGGDANESLVVLRTYDELFIWERSTAEPIGDAFTRSGCRLARIDEQQGEAVALLPDGRILTTSEGEAAPISLFSLPG